MDHELHELHELEKEMRNHGFSRIEEGVDPQISLIRSASSVRVFADVEQDTEDIYMSKRRERRKELEQRGEGRKEECLQERTETTEKSRGVAQTA
jgi:hypothetical protein